MAGGDQGDREADQDDVAEELGCDPESGLGGKAAGQRSGTTIRFITT